MFEMKKQVASFLSMAFIVLFFGHCNFKCSWRDVGFIRALFYPPEQDMRGGLPADTSGGVYDHSAFDALLKSYVDDRGAVDYGGLAAGGADRLRSYVDGLAKARPDSLGLYEKLALYINAYNAFTLQLMIDHKGVESIKKIDKAWDRKEWNLGGRTISLNDLEHKWIRGNFAEPRIHFVLVCAAKSCPWLRNEVYVGARLPFQLADQTNRFYSRPDAGYRRNGNIVFLSSIMDWYRNDFVSNAGDLVTYLARTHPDRGERDYLSAHKDDIRLKYMPYSWDLNGSW